MNRLITSIIVPRTSGNKVLYTFVKTVAVFYSELCQNK